MTISRKAAKSPAVKGCGRDRVEVYACGKNAAILMISVVAADLGAAGSGVEADLSLRVLGESDLKPFYYLSKSVCVSLCFVGITAVDLRSCARSERRSAVL